MPYLRNPEVASTPSRDCNRVLPLVTVAQGQASRTHHGAVGDVAIWGGAWRVSKAWESAKEIYSLQEASSGQRTLMAAYPQVSVTLPTAAVCLSVREDGVPFSCPWMWVTSKGTPCHKVSAPV